MWFLETEYLGNRLCTKYTSITSVDKDAEYFKFKPFYVFPKTRLVIRVRVVQERMYINHLTKVLRAIQKATEITALVANMLGRCFQVVDPRSAGWASSGKQLSKL